MGTQVHEKVFNVLVEKDEDGYYVGSVVELRGCHTQAKTLDQLRRRIKEAIEGYLEVSSQGHGPEFVGVQQLRLKTL
ncbi:MAG: type II toxin-antitoxin system HicB family antitoxin [Nitrososphaerales archaeon]